MEKSIEQLSIEFVDLCILQYEKMNSHLVKEANKAFDKIYRIASKIRRTPDGGRDFLVKLVNHPHRNVRAHAAYLLFPIDQQLSIKTLKEIERNGEFAWEQINARTCIEEWKAGRLDVDWFLKKYH